MSAHDDTGVRTAGKRAPHALPSGTTVGRVSLQVSELERSVTFYETVLGFRAIERASLRASLGDSAGAVLLELQTGDGVSMARPGSLGLYHFAVLLPDRAALGRLIRHLADRGIRVSAADHLVSEAIYLHDVDGLGIEVYADRPREAWTTLGGELAITTEPLDFDRLLAAAGSEQWQTLPAGTKIGHVHLHVGELPRARQFYHEQLGLDIVVSSYPGALFLSAGGYHHHLGVNTWAGPHARLPPTFAARLLYWELVVPDVAAAREAANRLRQGGHPVTELIAEAVWEVQDPWRTALRIRAAG